MKMLYLIFFTSLQMQISFAWNDDHSSHTLKWQADAHQYRVICEMDTILEFLMCGEDETHFANRDVVMLLGESLSGKTTIIEYFNDIVLKSITTTTETEEYIISKNYINFERFYSLTVIPQQFFEKNTNTTFYDCPSFSNFQNLSSAVISSYLLEKVADLAERVKIVLTVSYSSVASGESEKNLLSLLTHTARFINNITHFHRGIALMVTKVENRWLENYQLVEDYTVREEIEEFLIDFKTHWILDQVEDYPFDNKHMYEKVLNLTDILLSIYSVDGNAPVRNESIDEDEINRIGLFRRPNLATSNLYYVTLLEERKKRLLATVHKAIEFTTVKQDDFSHILGENEILLAYSVKNMVNQVVTNKTKLIANYFVKFFEDGGKPYDIYLTKQFFENGFSVFNEMYMELYNLKDIARLPEIMAHASQVLNIGIPNEQYLDLKVNIDYMLFLERMAPYHLYISVSQWIEPFWSIYESLRRSNIWYIFLNELHKWLIDEVVVKGKVKFYDTANIEEWGKLPREKGINITEYNYGTFMKKLEHYNLDRWDDVVQYEPTAKDLTELNTILNISLRAVKHSYCENNVLKFTGVQLQTSLVKIYKNCTPKVVIFYATDSISIDHNLDYRSQKVSVVFMAPRIHMPGGYRTIDLSGKDGEKTFGPIIDITFFGERGSDGNAGSPGNASGHFMLICEDLSVQGGELKIFIRGGKGMDGQRGGRGGIGISRTYENPITYLESKDDMPDVREYDACIVISKNDSSASFKLMKCGTCGGSGGNGGKGGMSGPKGIFKMAALGGSYSGLQVIDEMRKGADGIGGKRGENGKTLEHIFIANFSLTDKEMCGEVLSKSCQVCNATFDGIAGKANIADSISFDTEVPQPNLEEIVHNFVQEMGHQVIDESKIRNKLGLRAKK